MDIDAIKTLVREWKLEEALASITPDLLEDPEIKLLTSSIYMQKGHYDKALAIGYASLHQAEEIQDYALQSKARTNISYALWYSGRMSSLEDFLSDTDAIYKKIPDQEKRIKYYWKNIIYSLRGLVLWRKGQHQEALKSLKEALGIANILKNRVFSANSHFILGIIWQSQGKIKQSDEVLHESLANYQDEDYKLGIVYCLTALGDNFHHRGKLDMALNYYVEALQIHKRIGNKQLISISYDRIGKIYEAMGELDDSHQFLVSSKDLRVELGNDYETAISYFNLVKHGINHKETDFVEKNLAKLQELAKIKGNKLVQLQANMAQGLYLMSLERFRYAIRAKNIFEDIIQMRVIQFELSIQAMLNYCRILFLELQISEEPKVIEEIEKLLTGMENLANSYQSYSILVEVMILQAKLFLIQSKVEESRERLNEAKTITQDLFLHYLEDKVNGEMEELESQIQYWMELVENNAGIIEKMETSSIMEYLHSVSTLNLNSNVQQSYGDVMGSDGDE